MAPPLRPPLRRSTVSDPMRPRAALRTAVVWDVLKDAVDGAGQTLDVLDTGGGTGNFAVPVAGLGHRVTVVDPSPNALFALERRAAEAGVAARVHGVQGDVHGLFDVVGRESFDVVLCHGVLEYLDQPAAGLGNVVAALRPGGTLSLLAAGLGGAVLARALAGHFSEAREALDDPEGRWGAADPVPHRFTAARSPRSSRTPVSRPAPCTAYGSSRTSCPASSSTPNPARSTPSCASKPPPRPAPSCMRWPPSCTCSAARARPAT
ncbi:LOW QUALITY PROTEIN: methyltransferase, partial [Streptomyces sp. SPB78]